MFRLGIAGAFADAVVLSRRHSPVPEIQTLWTVFFRVPSARNRTENPTFLLCIVTGKATQTLTGAHCKLGGNLLL